MRHRRCRGAALGRRSARDAGRDGLCRRRPQRRRLPRRAGGGAGAAKAAGLHEGRQVRCRRARRQLAHRGARRIRCGVRRSLPSAWRLPCPDDGRTDRRRLCLRARCLPGQRQDRHFHALRRIWNPDGRRCVGCRARCRSHARRGSGRVEGHVALCVAAQSCRRDRAGVDRSAAHDELHSDDAGKRRVRHVRRNLRQRSGQSDLCRLASSNARRCDDGAGRLRAVAHHVGSTGDRQVI